jgi:hypothetical protein
VTSTMARRRGFMGKKSMEQKQTGPASALLRRMHPPFGWDPACSYRVW